MRPEMLNLPEPNWFHHGEQILPLLEERRPMSCVELGSNRGCSAIAVARLLRQWGGILTCVDCWRALGPGEVNLGMFVDNIKSAGIEGSIRVIQSDTLSAALDWKDLIDYLYVDAGHTKAECLADLEAWWPFLKVGGLIAGDDYDDPHGIPEEGVTKAWDVFERSQGQAFNRTLTPGLELASRLIWGIKR